MKNKKIRKTKTSNEIFSSVFNTSAVSHINFPMIVPFKTPISLKGETFRLWILTDDRQLIGHCTLDKHYTELGVLKTLVV